MTKKNMLKSLPVLRYHYISSWPDSLAVDPDIFEQHLVTMTEQGYESISLDQAQSYFLEGAPLPEKSVLLSFDKGFLDSYVTAWPLLAKHGHKGVIFAVTNKIVQEKLPRPTLLDLWEGFVNADELPQVNTPERTNKAGIMERKDLFFSWEEARCMENSSTIQLAAHTHTHRSVFAGPGFTDVYVPGKRRTFDRIDTEVLFGLPCFPVQPALAGKAFIPSDMLYDLVRNTVPQAYTEAVNYFANPVNKEPLLRRIREIPRDKLGRMESQEEFEARVRADLSSCHDALHRELHRPPTALAWPWGKAAPEAFAIAKELGFTTFFTTAKGSNPSAAPGAVCRCTVKNNKKAGWVRTQLATWSHPVKARLYSLLQS